MAFVSKIIVHHFLSAFAGRTLVIVITYALLWQLSLAQSTLFEALNLMYLLLTVTCVCLLVNLWKSIVVILRSYKHYLNSISPNLYQQLLKTLKRRYVTLWYVITPLPLLPHLV